MRFRLDADCDECRAIARALRDAARLDRVEMKRRLSDIAASSGRDVDALRLSWVFSLARLPDDEMRTVMRAHTPRTDAAKRRQSEHEAATGHSVHILGRQGLYEL